MPSDTLSPAEFDHLVDRVVQRGYRLRTRRRIIRAGSIVLAAVLAMGTVVALRGTPSAEKVRTIAPGPSTPSVDHSGRPAPVPGGPPTSVAAVRSPGPAVALAARKASGALPGGSARPGGATGAAGGQIAFSGADGNIYLVNRDGSSRHSLGAGLDPAWSPDGSQIAFWRGTGDTSGCENDPLQQTPKVCVGDVWVMRADGSNARLLISNGMKPSWSPDGRRIAYSTAQADAKGLHDLSVANADGGGAKQVTSGFADVGAKWSPDGRRIIFGRCCISQGASSAIELYEIAPDGSNVKRVFGSADIGSWAPAWSPDGKQVAFTGYNYGANKVSIWVLDYAAGTADPVTEAHQAGKTWVDNMDYGPAWSPDGKRIAYSFDPDGASGTGDCDAGPTTGCAMGGSQPGVIYLMNPDGSNRTSLTEGAWPAFQP